jgi:HEAT repeat protein
MAVMIVAALVLGLFSSQNVIADRLSGGLLVIASQLIAPQQQLLPDLVIKLREGNALSRKRAAAEIGEISDFAAFEPLIQTVQRDPDQEVRRAASNALLRMCAVHTYGHHGDAAIGSDELWPLVEAGPNAVPFLVEALVRDEDIAVPAAIALGFLRDARSVEPLFRVARRSGNISTASLKALIQIRPPNVVERILELPTGTNFWSSHDPLELVIGKMNGEIAPFLPAIFSKLNEEQQSRLIGYLDGPRDSWADRFLQSLSQGGDTRALRALMARSDAAMAPVFLEALDGSYAAEAARALGRTKSATALDPLRKALNSPHAKLSASAAVALGELADADSLAAIREVARGDESDRELFELARAKLKDVTLLPQIESRLRGKGEAEFYHERQLLREIGKAALPTLLDWIEDPQAKVRMTAAVALVSIDDVAATDALMLAMSDLDWEVRDFAALGLSRERRTVPVLIRALSDPNRSVQCSAIHALGTLKDESAVPALINKVGHIGWLLYDPAVRALVLTGRASFTPALAAYKGNHPYKHELAIVLGRVGDARAVPDLIKGLSDPRELVVLRSAEALGRLGDRRAVQPLGALGRWPLRERRDGPMRWEPQVKEAARSAISRILWRPVTRDNDDENWWLH